MSSKCGIETPSFEETLVDPTLTGKVTLDESAAHAIAEQLCKPLTKCIIKTIEEAKLKKITATEATVERELKLGASAEKKLLKTVEDHIKPKLAVMLTGATLSGVDLKAATMDVATLSNILDGILATAALNKQLKIQVMKWVGEDIQALLQGKILAGVGLAHADIRDSHITRAEMVDPTLERAHFKGTTEFSGSLVYSKDARESLAVTLKEVFGIERLVSADGHALNGTEGLVTGCILNRELEKVLLEVDAIEVFRYADGNGKMLPNGARVVPYEEYRNAMSKLTLEVARITNMQREIEALTETVEKLSTDFVEYRQKTSDRLHALEMAEVARRK